MKKLFIFLVLLCGCGEPGKYPLPQDSPQKIWHEAKEWEVLNIRNPRTPEEIQRCKHRGSLYLFRIMTIKNGEEIKEIVIQ
jgi:hypothetical protein